MSWIDVTRDIRLALILAAAFMAVALTLLWPIFGRDLAFGITSFALPLAAFLLHSVVGYRCSYDEYAIKGLVYFSVAAGLSQGLLAFSTLSGPLFLLGFSYVFLLVSLTLGWLQIVFWRGAKFDP